MKYKLGILGLGKMGGSILSGIIKSNICNKKEVLLFDTNDEIKQKYISMDYVFSIDEQQLFNNCEKIIIAIKPQMFNILNKLNYEGLYFTIISIAAGKTIDDLKKIFGNKPIIRVMPNTPAFIMSSASAISKSDNVSNKEINEVKKIFTSIGIIEEIPEDKMNEIIPINGSMPAYLYYFAEAFINNGLKNGIDYEVCKKLACEAIIGSAKMILQSDKNIDQLIKDVCSPGGTTIEGLKKLEENKFQKIIEEACEACIKRAYEL